MNGASSENKIMTKASLSAWTRLFDATDRIKEYELWKVFCEVDLAEITLPEDIEPYYCCISGMYESPKGISIYRGHKGLISFSHYVNSVELPDYISDSKRNCLECTWGARKDLRKKDMEILRACERKYRGAEAWPLYRKHEQGYEPWFLRDEDVVILARVLEELAKAAEQLVASDMVSAITAGYRIGRRFDFTEAQYVNEFLPPLEKIEAMTEGCIITDEVLIRRLKKRPSEGSVMEFDMPFFPMSVKSKGRDPRPFFPRMCIMCDTEKGIVTEHYMISRYDDPRDVALGIIIHHIENKGRPSTIFVRDPEIYGIISHLCSSVDVEVFFTPSLNMLDYFLNDMVEALSDEDENDF